ELSVVVEPVETFVYEVLKVLPCASKAARLSLVVKSPKNIVEPFDNPLPEQPEFQVSANLLA
ncbi:MAG: hypothetical protein L6461_24265, partial [Anaerolineae bacterium]|nr:hypothetical protein [Anaerolineae bacterium]